MRVILHINGDVWDNRPQNLRVIEHPSSNYQNTTKINYQLHKAKMAQKARVEAATKEYNELASLSTSESHS